MPEREAHPGHSASPITITDLPGQIVQECEEGTILGSCDWGDCNRPQAGWAGAACDPEDEWLAVCEIHIHGNDEFPVVRSWTFAVVERALGWQEGAILGA